MKTSNVKYDGCESECFRTQQNGVLETGLEFDTEHNLTIHCIHALCNIISTGVYLMLPHHRQSFPTVVFFSVNFRFIVTVHTSGPHPHWYNKKDTGNTLEHSTQNINSILWNK